MNSSQRNSSSSASPLNSYQFDFDLGLPGRSAASRPLNPAAAAAPKPAAAPSWSPQPSKPSWTHQPAPRSTPISAPPTSMVGDIFGKTWSPAPTPSSSASLGIPNKNPNLFGDLLGSALGAKPSAPLKSAAPRTSYSMGNLSDSLPKPAAASAPANPIPSWKSAENLNSYTSTGSSAKPAPAPVNSKRDPFESLSAFAPVKPPSAKSDYAFGDFQNAKPAKAPFPQPPPPSTGSDYHFPKPAQGKTGSGADPFTAFSTPEAQPQKADPLDTLFASSATGITAEVPEASGWDFGTEFGGEGGATTTELEGLPPPPAGVSAASAKSKGMDHYKQGQYADAIKWLTWSVVLFDKSGDSGNAGEVLTCRASCYKEVGEYKKAVADCSKVLEHDGENVTVLVQRALLYESTEKYRLGADDLRTVLKIDPGNRLARSTIHRLNKLAD